MQQGQALNGNVIALGRLASINVKVAQTNAILSSAISSLQGTIVVSFAHLIHAITKMPVDLSQVLETSRNEIRETFAKVTGFSAQVYTPSGYKGFSDPDSRQGLNKEIEMYMASLKTMAAPSSKTNPADQLKKDFENALSDKGLFGALTNTLGGVFNSLTMPAKNMGKVMGGAIGSVAPQMMAMKIALEPMNALINGILAPLEPLTEIFGAFGQIIGTALMPIMQEIIPILLSFMPILQAIIPPIGQFLLALFKFSDIGLIIAIITPLMPLLQQLANLFGALMTAVMPIAALLSNLVGLFAQWLVPIIGVLVVAIQPAIEWLNNLATAGNMLTDSLKTIYDWFNSIGNSINNYFAQGGLDKNTQTWY